jgi:hypothetical protein
LYLILWYHVPGNVEGYDLESLRTLSEGGGEAEEEEEQEEE